MTDNERIDQPILSRYKVIRKLGAGAYGIVWKVSPLDRPNEQLALKKVFEAFQHSTDAQRTYRQISILKKLEHENIIKLHEVWPSVSGRDIYLVFQYMSTDLYRTIYENQLQEIHKKYIMYQLLKGLLYLHSADVLHRDLKPSNLLLSAQCQLKICDFGLARHLEGQGEENVLTEGVATRWYRAPEVLMGCNDYDSKADIWSVGCIFAEMLIKAPLFNCSSMLGHFQKIVQVVGRPTVEELGKIGEVAGCLMQQCGNVRQKPLKQLLGSGTSEIAVDLLGKMLKFDHSKRLSAKQLLQHEYFRQFYRENQLVTFKGVIRMQTDQNVKLSTEAYRKLIEKNFISSIRSERQSQPQRFSDLRREKSFGKIIEQINSRKSSCERDGSQRKNNSLFEQLIKDRNRSSSKGNNQKQVSTPKVRTQSKGTVIFNDKQNLNINKNPTMAPLDKFNQKAGTFAALRKVTASKFNR